MRIYILTLLLFPLFLFAPLAAQENNREELASVAILPYEDKTGTENFGYLPDSLIEAIDGSMKEDFTYRRISSSEVKQFLNKNSGADKSSNELIKKAGNTLKADIIIFGHFIYDEETKQITIFTGIYFPSLQEITEVGSISNPVDNTIFQVTEKVAQQIVNEINRILATHRTATKQEKKEGKQKVTRAALQTRGLSWNLGVEFKPVFSDITGQSSLDFNVISLSALLFEISMEQRLAGVLSTYGSFGFSGFLPPEPDFVIKIPSYSIFANLVIIPIVLITGKMPGLLMIDGLMFNFRVSPLLTISPFLGSPFYLQGNTTTNQAKVIWGSEAGFKLKFFLNPQNYLSVGATYLLDIIELINATGTNSFQHLEINFGWSYVFGK